MGIENGRELGTESARGRALPLLLYKCHCPRNLSASDL